jgi:hypothetical protein
MVEAGGFDSNECLACLQRRQFLQTDLDHLRTAGPECPGNPTLSRLIHDESPYHRPTYGVTVGVIRPADVAVHCR